MDDEVKNDFSWGLAIGETSAATSFRTKAMDKVIRRGSDEKVKSDGTGSLMSMMLALAVKSVKVWWVAIST